MAAPEHHTTEPLAVSDPGGGPAAAERRRSRVRYVTLRGFLAALFAVALDQLSKFWAESSLVVDERHPLLGDLLAIQLAYNPGAAFSLAASATPIITGLAVAGSALAGWLTWRTATVPWALSLGVILGGAIGNVIDRLARPPGPGRGHVVDFIAYSDWFIGNIADVFVFAGLAVCITLSLMGKPMRPDHPGLGADRRGSDRFQPESDDTT